MGWSGRLPSIRLPDLSDYPCRYVRDEEQGWHDICNGEDKKDEDNMGSEEGSTEDESSGLTDCN